MQFNVDVYKYFFFLLPNQTKGILLGRVLALTAAPLMHACDEMPRCRASRQSSSSHPGSEMGSFRGGCLIRMCARCGCGISGSFGAGVVVICALPTFVCIIRY